MAERDIECNANTGQNMGYDTSQLSGQPQLRRDEWVNQPSNPSNPYQTVLDKASDNYSQNSGYDLKGQATNFLHQTGEQVKHIAQGAADAVKNTLGMNNADNTGIPTSVNPPNNTSYPASTTNSRV